VGLTRPLGHSGRSGALLTALGAAQAPRGAHSGSTHPRARPVGLAGGRAGALTPVPAR